MKYLLDTNICIHLFRGKFDLMEKFDSVSLDDCVISEITLAELVYGSESSSNPKKNLNIINDFTEQVKVLPIFNAISFYAKEKVRLKKAGTLISDFDLLIGCTAIANNLIMVSENVREFSRISNIQLENWVNR